METIISEYISGIYFGKVQSFKNMQVIPLFSDQKADLDYLTLKEALEKRLLTIQEVNQAASVPELKVMNQTDLPVLLLDGEELAGAKQNRVLNTTILVKAKSGLVIPVSCTEQGRWSYRSAEFSDSDVVIPSFLRAKKASSVNVSLNFGRNFQSDQQGIWEGIMAFQNKADVHSPTGAMKDVFEKKKKNLEDYLKAFPCLPLQKGVFVFLGGKVAGLDILSREEAFGTLFPKLVKSYAIDALLEEKEKDKISLNPEEEAKQFLLEAKDCQEKKYSSVGQGWDYRFEGKDMVGSALVHNKSIIHMAFFQISKEEKTGRMSGYKRRREYRL